MSAYLPYIALALLVLIWLRVERLDTLVKDLHDSLRELRRDLGVSPPLAAEPSEQVRRLAADPAKTIEAITRYREESGAGLKQALEVVTALQKRRTDA